MPKPDFSDALRLFSEEQAALRAGAMDQVTAIGQKKEAILSDLTDLQLSREQALRLRDEAEKSAKMLSAAIQGVKDARTRLAALEKIRDGLSVYTEKGDRRTVAKAHSGLHHKV